MSNHKANPQEEYENPIDAVLHQSPKGELSRPDSVEQDAFAVKADDLLFQPEETSLEHSMDDTHETLTKSRFDGNDLLEAAEGAGPKNE
jgi:hypothetical protein